MKTTIYDVAKEAGVSIATVSNVINNNGRVGEKTRQKVLKTMAQLEYSPSVVASALTGKKTNTVGLLIPDISNPFFADIARSIEDRGNELGISVIICSTDNLEEKEKKYISLLIRKSVDGFILASGVKSLDLLEEVMEKKIPVALIANDIPSLPITTVTIDDFKGGYIGTKHLLSLNHTKIAMIAEHAWSNIQRINGYKQALLEQNVEPREEYFIKTEATIERGKEAGLQLLNLEEPPSAIFACNDLLAIGAIEAARELGFDLPNDLSVIGFDNTVLCRLTVPKLTSVSQPIHDMGKKVFDMLLDSDFTNQKTLFMPELVVRESSGKYKDTV
ncbi:LacI family DNA-binding transcriptional regulator [Halalkalibacter alkaliphilus]|uniref:LacI family transcriptional regulator n=1 Tax=Halalkalibacter alkaliphilus TaxID=2917993 RepID=A0A9X2A2K8_9BACI|nr:LacI family DNA-binding transcriptional regulator [Halalkalibacter alkaliphilus]MCL7745607.1 LacI family transcriptional regulator [Halalkalibacter alkaliphilus]